MRNTSPPERTACTIDSGVPDPHRGRKDGPAALEQKATLVATAQATARASPTIIPETVP
jgi:hypothetical protein